MNTFQKTCLTPLGFLLVFYWLHYFAPVSWVAWGWDIESPLWACFIDNNPIFDWFGFFTIPSYIPLLIIVFSIFGVVVMYDIERIVIRFKETNYLKNNEGVTLVEIMTVIAIMGIMSTIAYANIDVKPYRHRAAAREFYSVVQYSKMLAIKTNRPVTICTKGNVYFVFTEGVLHRTFPLNYGITISSNDVPAGNIGKQNLPHSVPQNIMDAAEAQCGVDQHTWGSCAPYMDWVNSFNGTDFDHMTVISPRSIVSSGQGTYNINMGNWTIPVSISMAGGVSIGQKTNI